jgi:hypothetical protein
VKILDRGSRLSVLQNFNFGDRLKGKKAILSPRETVVNHEKSVSVQPENRNLYVLNKTVGSSHLSMAVPRNVEI